MHNRTLRIGIGVVLGLLLASASIAWSAKLDPVAGPDDPATQMYTLQQLYDRLATGAQSSKMTVFTEPTGGPPADGMPTLDEIMDKAPEVDSLHGATVADVASGKTFWGLTEGEWGTQIGVASPVGYGIGVPKTGQPLSYAYRDDGQLRKGVSWPHPRFVAGAQGIVTDTLTGLIWLQQADCFGLLTWEVALTAANELADGACGLADGSVAGDWRLPNVREQQSLIDYGSVMPALPDPHPFDFPDGWPPPYWTSTTVADDNDLRAWTVGLYNGLVEPDSKAGGSTYRIWPVKGGQ
jgi:hypothetical protein